MAEVPARKTSFRCTGSLNPDLHAKFERFVCLMESLYGVSLSSTSFSSSRDLKQFCSGLIEGEVGHPWRRCVGALSAQNRLGFAHSLFLFRKVIPSEKPQVDAYVRKLSTPQESPDPEFLSFAKDLVRKLFRPGWDRSYVGHVFTSSLPVSSCSEVGRSGGGSRGWQSELRWDRTEFAEYVLDSVVPRNRGASRVNAVLTGGKWRIISIPPRVDNALRPLHKALYSHISRMPWLLRGDAKPTKFKDFTPVDGEVFVSGDYESATDNLNSELQRAILAELFESSSSIPQGIKEHALDVYVSKLRSGDETFVQRRGQLMGQLTSFPLLCLVNYITFRYSIRRRVPCRINGDDIVFRATPDECARWERNVAKGGLTLSKGKTLVHRRGFTLNSTPFWSVPRGAKAVGFVRSSALYKQDQLSALIQSMNGRFYSCCSGYGRERTSRVRREFVDYNQRAVHASRRSLTRGLGLAVDQKLLRSVGLWHRELYYLEQVEERPVPSKARGELPEGWAQVGRHTVDQEDLSFWEREWGWACVEHAWVSNFEPSNYSEDAIMDFIREGCPPYGLGSLMNIRVRRMLHLSRSGVWKWLYSRTNESVFGRVRRDRGKGVWVKVDQVTSRNLMVFVKQSVDKGALV